MSAVVAAQSARATASAFADARWLAWAAHVDVLDRHPDPAWWDAATERVQRGEAVSVLYRELIGSAEWRADIEPVLRFYRSYLGRLPDVAGAEHWVDEHVVAHVPLAAIAEAIGASAEFAARSRPLADTAFVDQLYRDLLGRPPDAAGAAYWESALRGGASRAWVVQAFSTAAEPVLAARPWTEVAAVFVCVRHQTPDPLAFDADLDRRVRDGHLGGVLDAATASPGYLRRWDRPLAPAPYPRLRVAVYGDSLAWEAEFDVTWLLQERGTAVVHVHSFCGTAPCDWVAELERDLREWRPNVVVAVFSGNAMTTCMAEAATGAAYFDRYLADARHYVELAAAAGADVLFVSPPARRGQPGLGHPAQIAYARASAERPGVARWVYGGTHVSPGDVYVDTLPCAPGEPCQWLQGRPVNQVRHPDGLHFCPTGTPRDWTVRCEAAYSPGALRYAMTIASAVRATYG